MKNIALEVARSDIERKVEEATGYLGVKAPVQGAGSAREDLVDRVSVIGSDRALLGSYIADTFTVIVERLKDFVSECEDGSEKITLTLEVSGSYDDSATAAVTRGIESALTAGVVARWLRMAYPDKAAEWEDESRKCLAAVERHLYHRIRPRRRKENQDTTTP